MAEKKKRGFAALPPERRQYIAMLGGRAVQEQGTAHRFTTEEARAAGKKGGGRPKKAQAQPLQSASSSDTFRAAAEQKHQSGTSMLEAAASVQSS
jgi:uncharacterized protein